VREPVEPLTDREDAFVVAEAREVPRRRRQLGDATRVSEQQRLQIAPHVGR
jgi:hypothetical protein